MIKTLKSQNAVRHLLWAFSLAAMILPGSVGLCKTEMYVYSRLALKDLDQMNKLMKDKIKESKEAKGDNKIEPLREALLMVYSRPNTDFMIEKLSGDLHNELDERGAWESTMRSLVEEACERLKKPEKIKAVAQVTYAVFLGNVIEEIKPKASEPFENSLLKTIQNAKIELTDVAKAEGDLGMMKTAKSPSLLAGNILKEIEAKAKKAKQK